MIAAISRKKEHILSAWKVNAFTCGGKELWKSMRAASSLCLENMILIIDTFTCVFASLEFTYCFSTMGNLIALGFVTLKFGDVVVLK